MVPAAPEARAPEARGAAAHTAAALIAARLRCRMSEGQVAALKQPGGNRVGSCSMMMAACSRMALACLKTPVRSKLPT